MNMPSKLKQCGYVTSAGDTGKWLRDLRCGSTIFYNQHCNFTPTNTVCCRMLIGSHCAMGWQRTEAKAIRLHRKELSYMSLPWKKIQIERIFLLNAWHFFSAPQDQNRNIPLWDMVCTPFLIFSPQSNIQGLVYKLPENSHSDLIIQRIVANLDCF